MRRRYSQWPVSRYQRSVKNQLRALGDDLVYEICSTTVEAIEAKIKKFTRRWLGIPPGLTDVAMYCRKAKLKLPLKSILEEYKCGKARLLSMLEDSEDPIVKTVQPTIKTGRKWKVVEAVDEAKECLKIKEVIGQTQTDRKGLGSSTAKWWSKAEGKEKRDMVINEIWLNEDSRRVLKAVQQPQQRQWTNWDNALQKSLTWNEIWHMAPLRISFLIRSCPQTQIWYGGERGPHLSAMPRQADHRACLELLQNRPLTGAIHMET
ncbi:hypothetical protein RRG08_047856 [Elysia crispata]|uniref:Uncharacterized protein n=1 Tax=Elysia crispata TaxID=231223 RepID=A0AAE0ZYF1_9GAST|nr:hypothetical protein RRG08_047856 [Elysia crispata]